MPKVLLIEDDVLLAEQIVTWLTAAKFIVEHTTDGADGSDRLNMYQYDVAVVDWELPNMTGIEICRGYRAKGGSLPILMLTAKDRLDDKEGGFLAGVDDYLTKPFSLKELTLRLHALLRRPTRFQQNTLKARNVSLDRTACKVLVGEREVHLQPLEFSLLEYLMRHKNQVFNPEVLLNKVWGSESEATVDTLRTYVKQIRKKIDVEGAPSIIRTLHGHGYVVEDDAAGDTTVVD